MNKTGSDAKLYYGPAGSKATNELENTKDVTLNLDRGEADVTTRGNDGWKASIPGLKEASVEWEMVWDTDDAGFTAIKDAYFSGDPIALAVLDGENGSGLDADFSIMSFSRNEPLEDAMSVSVTAKPARSSRAPQWID